MVRDLGVLDHLIMLMFILTFYKINSFLGPKFSCPNQLTGLPTKNMNRTVALDSLYLVTWPFVTNLAQWPSAIKFDQLFVLSVLGDSTFFLS